MEIRPKSRELYDGLAQGWNTWDVRSVTTHALLPERIGVTLSFFMPSQSRYRRDIAWENVDRFGEHSADGAFTDVTLVLWGRKLRVTTCSAGDELLIRILPVELPNGDLFVAAELEPLWGAQATVTGGSDRLTASVAGKTLTVDSPTARQAPEWNPCRGANLVWSAYDTVYLRVNSTKTPAQIDAALQKAETGWMSGTLHSSGEFEEGLSAMRRSLLWNTVYESKNRRVLSPVTRNWCRSEFYTSFTFGDYVVFGWDTFFAALMLGMIDKRLAYANFFAMLEEITPEGMVPNYGSGKGISVDRSEPQVGAWCAWKLYLQHGDAWFIAEVFDRLLAWNQWCFRERDGNGDGLMELASKPAGCGKQGAMWESGLDNSPMWDEAGFNEEKQCMELSYVGLNALVAADCEVLEKMATLLGRDRERAELAGRRQALQALIDRELWSEAQGTYLNKHWSGAFSPRLSPTHFYPMLAGIPDARKTDRMLREHLLNPAEFWGEYVIPTTSRTEEAFKDQNYWRGRIWAPTNFLVYEGLRRAGRQDVAARVAHSGFDMFVRRWRQNVVGENYNAITGEAGEKGTPSDPFYHWGALLVYMAIQEIVDFQVWDDAVRTVKAPDYLASIENVPIRGKRLSLGAGSAS